MPDPLGVICLISGGKDSFFSMLHCIVNGHKIVALANLYPQTPSLPDHHATEFNHSLHSYERVHVERLSEDIESFMYQTAGHTLIPLYADALDLPLYRQEITGTAADSSKYYANGTSNTDIAKSGPSSEDETECLLPLLKMVMANHPDANAVCSGAILSTYQRTRIESIATRLGLVSLSYLWQYPYLPPPSPAGLLNDMMAVGFDVRLVKVASGGLAESLLWCNLMDTSVRDEVQKAVARFGGSVLGEGGEYETLVVDGPSPVWKRRIEVSERTMQQRVERGSGGAAYLQFGAERGRALAKERKVEEEWTKTLRRVGHWDREFDHLNNSLTNIVSRDYCDLKESASVDLELPIDQLWIVSPQFSELGSLLYISNLISANNGSSASEQMQDISQSLVDTLGTLERSPNDIVFTTILLRSISADFASVNQTYGQLFDQPIPPARVTVSTPLPPGIKVMVSVVVNLAARDARDGLHVQSRSYWAPANIGPYSQAISVCLRASLSLVYVAGQIPLVPATMEVVQTDPNENTHGNEMLLFQHQACLSLQHLWRIGTRMGVGWWTGSVAYVTGGSDTQAKVHIAYQTWKEVHQRDLWQQEEPEDDEADPWDKMYGGLGSLVFKDQPTTILPDYRLLAPGGSLSPIPGFLAVQVDELPRSCAIEWQSLGVARGQVEFTTAHVAGADAKSCIVQSPKASITYVYIRQPMGDQGLSALADIMNDVRNQVLTSMHCERLAISSSTTIYTPSAMIAANVGAQVVPCRAVWGPEFEELVAGIVLHVETSP